MHYDNYINANNAAQNTKKIELILKLKPTIYNDYSNKTINYFFKLFTESVVKI